MVPFESGHPAAAIRCAWHLATASAVFVDNYFGTLAAAPFRQGVPCIQLWHAAGAFKAFGLEDRSIRQRSKAAKKRFLNVYRRFDKVVVGSEKMAEIFKRSFGLTDDRLLRSGVPRTDYFYRIQNESRAGGNAGSVTANVDDSVTLKPVQAAVSGDEPFTTGLTAVRTGAETAASAGENGVLDCKRGSGRAHSATIGPPARHRRKKIILYAPTYRDDTPECTDLHLDVPMMKQRLGQDYLLLLRVHPAVQDRIRISETVRDFVIDCSSEEDIDVLLAKSDLLITDYSSLPVEFSLLRRPMIFYPYDLERYGKSRGFQNDYLDLVPGPVAFSTRRIISLIRDNAFDFKKIARFSEEWNMYSKGRSSYRVVQYMKKVTDLSSS